jgi:hypothetical protein
VAGKFWYRRRADAQAAETVSSAGETGGEEIGGRKAATAADEIAGALESA